MTFRSAAETPRSAAARDDKGGALMDRDALAVQGRASRPTGAAGAETPYISRR